MAYKVKKQYYINLITNRHPARITANAVPGPGMEQNQNSTQRLVSIATIWNGLSSTLTGCQMFFQDLGSVKMVSH